ncbi:reverse transcriptase-like protein [Bacillus mangrovi]|uniref:Reverse transcriptase-like protein n=1 Tax=Metabacillus mangrovi TaxID=1491830 RepID=A0A7X2S1P2_9BACI|nr:reverse transcriptase-like protein [Metabacillus mangrovi]MTH52099.1 reverse transcriptase-like protein [Metabacillus mangrovi]
MKVRLHWTYVSPKKQTLSFQSDELDASAALKISEDLEKTGRTKSIEFEDTRGVTWTKKELGRLLEEMKHEPSSITVFFDGSFDKDTGQSGTGAAIYYSLGHRKHRVRINLKLDGLETSNEAEFAALLMAVRHLEELGARGQELTIKGDSLVVINQMSGEWPAYEGQHQTWISRIEDIFSRLSLTASYEAVPRKENKEADQLSKQAILGTEVSSSIKLD